MKGITEYFSEPKVYIKRGDFNYLGAHKLNNISGQAMLAKLGFKIAIYMGSEDVERQYVNVFWMKCFGMEVIPM